MHVANDEGAIDNRLSRKPQHQAHDAMRAGMLWPQIEHHLVCVKVLLSRFSARMRIALSWYCQSLARSSPVTLRAGSP